MSRARSRKTEEYDFEKIADHQHENKSETAKRHFDIDNFAWYKKAQSFLSKYGKTKISVETTDLKSLVNALKEYKIAGLKQKDEGIEFYCFSKDSEKIIALLNSLCYNSSILKRNGVLRALSFLKRQGMVAGLFCIISALVLYSQTVLNVEIDGIINSDVNKVLERNGIVQMKLCNFDEKAVERELLALDGVSFASVDKVGTRVYVRILPELDKEEFASLSGGRVCATKSAEISRIICFGGTPVVEKGQNVNGGDVLIAPYVLVGDVETPTVASGEVYGFVNYTATEFYPDEVLTKKEGKEQKKRVLSFFGKEKGLEFSGGDLKTTRYKNDFLLPYVLTKYSFVPVTYEYEQNSLDESEMKSKTLTSLIENIKDAEIIGIDTQIKRTGNGYAVTATVKTEELIS